MALWQYGTASNPGVAGQHDILFEDLYEEVMCATPTTHLSYILRTRLEKVNKTDRSSVVNRLRCGCSPLFVACKNGNVEIVEYLVATCSADVELRCKLLVTSSADIQKPNYNGGTCLMNSIQSVEMCEFLLQHGADINAQDIQGKTALHYAIQENRFEITKLLLLYGANRFLESRSEDDALQTACLRGVEEIFQYLIDMLPYTPERITSAFELLGSTFLEEQLDS